MKLRDLWTTDTAWDDPFRAESKSALDTPFGMPDASAWPTAVWTPGLQSFAELGGLGSSTYSAIYRAQPSVYTVVEFLAWQISQIGIKAFRRVSDTEREPLRDHPLAALLRDPVAGMTYERWLHQLVADICVYGNAYWVKVEAGSDRALAPIVPSLVTPLGGNMLEAATYRINNTGGVPVEFDRDQIVHFRRYNPDDPRIGISPLEPLRRVLAEEAAASADREGFWKNKARMGGILKHPGKLSDEAFERIKESWNAAYTGASRSGQTAILEEGVDFQQTQFSPKEAEFITGRRLTLETVARAYNVPVSVLGLTETATYASQREFHKSLYQDTLGPWLKMIEGEINRAVIPWVTDEDNLYVEFNIAEKLKGSFEEQTDALRAWVGVPPMSVNEWRARYNLPPLEDEAFDDPVMPANVVYGGAGGNGQPPMPEDNTNDGATSSAASKVVLLKENKG